MLFSGDFSVGMHQHLSPLTIRADTSGMAVKQQQKGTGSRKLFPLDVKDVWGRNELFHMSGGSYFLGGSHLGCATGFIKGGFVSG